MRVPGLLRRFAALGLGLASGLAPRRQARWVAMRLRVQGWVLKILSAERLERIFGCPCGWRGRPGQCAAFRPRAGDLSGDRVARALPDGPVTIFTSRPPARNALAVTSSCHSCIGTGRSRRRVVLPPAAP